VAAGLLGLARAPPASANDLTRRVRPRPGACNRRLAWVSGGAEEGVTACTRPVRRSALRRQTMQPAMVPPASKTGDEDGQGGRGGTSVLSSPVPPLAASFWEDPAGRISPARRSGAPAAESG